MRDPFHVLGKLCSGPGISAVLLAAAVTAAAAQDTMRVTSRNLPEVLKTMEKSAPANKRVNEYTVVKGSRASGRTFITTYVIDAPDVQLKPSDFTAEDIRTEAKSMCGQKNLKILMKYGATFGRIYQTKKGATLYKVEIDRERCQKLA